MRGVVLGVASIAWSIGMPAYADGIDDDAPTARSIGRAGANLVSDDGASAIWQNPAALSRREATRVQVGGVVQDNDLRFDGVGDAPRIDDRSAPRGRPTFAAVTAVGPLVLGIAYLEPTQVAARMTQPEFSQEPSDVSEFFPHRYGGFEFAARRRALAGAAAIRVSDSIALGLSAAVERLTLRESRAVWAGFSGRDSLGSPLRDLSLTLHGEGWSANSTASLFVAPFDVPFEFTLAVSGRTATRVRGGAELASTRSGGPFATGNGDGANTRIPMSLVIRPGIRYVGDGLSAEVSANLRIEDNDGTPPSWSTGSLTAVDESGVEARLGRVPSRLSHQSHASVQGAVDINVIPGFLWLVAGYRFHTAASSRGFVSPVYGDIGGHTVGGGIEAYWNDIALSIGYARTMALSVSRARGRSFALQDNPFSAGAELAAPGRYDRASDAFGLSAEIAWE